MQRTIIIGDIHGCYHTLTKMLNDNLHFSPNSDRLIATGDLINRGAYSKKVLDLFVEHQDSMSTVRGNHDHWFLGRILANDAYFQVNPNSSDKEFRPLDSTKYGDKIQRYAEYISKCGLVCHLTDEITIVHAGFPPEWNHRKIPDEYDDSRKILFLARRWHDSLLEFKPAYKEILFDTGLPYWYDLYKEKDYGGTVIFGHDAITPEITISKGKTTCIGLDTGAGHKNKLSAYSATEDKFYSIDTLEEDFN